MTAFPKVGRMRLIALLAASTLALAAVLLDRRTAPSTNHHPADNYPELFEEVTACPHRSAVLENARRSEELGRLRADRYSYDPRDGVRAVQRYQQAEACYRAAGEESGVSRTRRVSARLTVRVNTDYAAARLNLINALEQERWSAALSEIHRLLLLTHHLGRHEYVEWLKKIIGRVAARASTTP